jgi:hypothetical protein
VGCEPPTLSTLALAYAQHAARRHAAHSTLALAHSQLPSAAADAAHAQQLLAVVGDVAAARLAEFDAMNLGSLVFAYSLLPPAAVPPALAAVLPKAAAAIAAELRPSHIAKAVVLMDGLAWGGGDEWRAFASAVAIRRVHLSPSELADIVVAVAHAPPAAGVDHRMRDLLGRLVPSLREAAPRMHVTDVSRVAAALLAAGVSLRGQATCALLDALAASAAAGLRARHRMHPAAAASLLQTYAIANHYSAALATAAAAVCGRRWADLTPIDAANTLWALAELRHLDSVAAAVLASRAISALPVPSSSTMPAASPPVARPGLSVVDIGKLAFAAAQLGMCDAAVSPAALSPAVLAVAADDAASAEAVCLVAWASAVEGRADEQVLHVMQVWGSC